MPLSSRTTRPWRSYWKVPLILLLVCVCVHVCNTKTRPFTLSITIPQSLETFREVAKNTNQIPRTTEVMRDIIDEASREATEVSHSG